MKAAVFYPILLNIDYGASNGKKTDSRRRFYRRQQDMPKH